MREISGFTVEEMAEKTEVSTADYIRYEAGELDFPFSFIHKCSLAFGIGITDLLEGRSAHLSSYTVTRKGEENPGVQAFVDWMLTEEGQAIVEGSGYVGVK